MNCGVPVGSIADRLAATSRLPATSSLSRRIDSTGPRNSRRRHGAGSTSSTTSSTTTAAWTRPGGCSTNSTTSKASPTTPGASATPSTNGSTGPTVATCQHRAGRDRRHVGDHDDRPGISQLAAPLAQWAQRRGLELQPPTRRHRPGRRWASKSTSEHASSDPQTSDYAVARSGRRGDRLRRNCIACEIHWCLVIARVDGALPK